ncbi:MAG: aminotransferase class IV [Labilithrix sp.]|nr:aminotransferase class IV [Labilithrix sp.]
MWIDGDFVAVESARVPFLDRGYQLGEGAFATLRAYDGRCFRADRHLAQLRRAAAAFGLSVPRAVDDVLDEAATRTGAADARVRVTVTDTTCSVFAEPMRVPTDDEYARGVAVVTVSARRIPPACFGARDERTAEADRVDVALGRLDASAKTTSYAMQTLARREAEARGAAEGIQLTLDGDLACATMANLFVVRGDALATPSLDSGCRAGVTRAAVLEIAKDVGLVAEERRVAARELRECDEAFLTSARIECLPIASVDGAPVARGSRAHALRAALRDLIRRERVRGS